MAVLVNFKICDNAKECGGIEVCPTGALSWSDEKETIEIDNDKCIACGRCEKECPIGAIRVAKTEEEYEKIKEEIGQDFRTIQDLFVDRYGAVPLSEFFMIAFQELEQKVGKGVTLVELYNDDSIQCLLKSIPIKKLTASVGGDMMFYKVEADEEIISKYHIKKLPALLLFKDHKYIDHIDGYYSEEEFDELVSQLHHLMQKD